MPVNRLAIPLGALVQTGRGGSGDLPETSSLPVFVSLQPSVLEAPLFGQRISSGSTRHWLALLAAATLHLAVLVAIWPAHTEDFGEAGTALESIAVTLVDRVQMMSAADAATPEAKELQSEAEAAREAVAKPEQPVPPKDPLPMAMLPEPTPPLDPLPMGEPEPDPIPEHVERTPQPAAPTAPTVLPSVSRAEANAGVERAYAKRLAELLDSRKPGSRQTRGLRGAVTVRFVVLETGKADGVTVLKSSGNGTLDGLVVATIEHLQLPPPPPEMSERQRTFNAPFAFR